MLPRLSLILVLSFVLMGCGTTNDFLKNVEGKAYDRTAHTITKYCELKNKDGLAGTIARQEALELRREIRQRGEQGPQGPTEKPEYLDDKTAYGPGPVVRIWCEGEPVPENVWWDFVRIK